MVKIAERQFKTSDYETVNQGSTLTSFGDSITAGNGTSGQIFRYAEVIAAAKGWTLTNNGVSGMKVGDEPVIDRAYAEVVDNTKNYTMMIGVNNAQNNGVDVGYLDTYRGCLMAAWAWLAIPDSYKVKAADATKAGTWVVNTGIYGSMDYKSTTNGSTMTAIVTGTTVYVGHIKTTPSGGTFTVSIDGVSYGTYATLSSKINARLVDGSAYQAYCLRFPGLQAGQHTVVITVTSATNAANPVYIDWIGGNGFKKDTDGPRLWVGNCTRSTDTYYTGHSPFTDASIALYNAAVDEVFAALSSDDLNISFVDAVHSINRTTDMNADGIHPNDTGNAKLAAAFLAQMSVYVKPRNRGQAQRRNTPWFGAAYGTGWTDLDAGGAGNWGGVRFMKDAMGFVHLRGLAKNNSGGTNNNTTNKTILTLPQGFRPKEQIRLATASADLFFEFDVTETGTVILNSAVSVANNGWVSFNVAPFYADQ